MTSIHFTDHLIAAILMIVAPLYALLGKRPKSMEGVAFNRSAKFSLYLSNSLVQWVIVLIVLLLWWWQGHPLRVMGLQMPNWDQALWVAVVFLAFWGAYAWNTWQQVSTPEALAKTQQHWLRTTPFMPVNRQEFWAFVGVAITAGVCEEIIFRGFLMTYLQALSYGSPKIQSVVVSAAVFAVLHVYQGRVAALKIFGFSLLFGALYALTNSIYPSIIVHALVDIISGWIGWKVILRERDLGEGLT